MSVQPPSFDPKLNDLGDPVPWRMTVTADDPRPAGEAWPCLVHLGGHCDRTAYAGHTRPPSGRCCCRPAEPTGELREQPSPDAGSTSRHRPQPGHLLPRDDPRVVAAIAASRCLGTFDWRDIAEIVNAVLEADDGISDGETVPVAANLP